MKIFNSADLAGPLGLVETGGGLRWRTFKVRYGLIEGGGGSMLVDTGYGPRIYEGADPLALRAYAALLRPKLLPFEVPAVDTILLTHLHADHVARLRDFPHARLLASRAALAWLAGADPAQARRHAVFRELLPDDLIQRAEIVEHLPWVSTETALGDGYDISGDGCHLAIPLPGHAPGHLGVFWRDGDTAILYATDAAWTGNALRVRTPALARRAVFDDVEAGLASEASIRAFMADGGSVVLCHDPA